MFTFAGKTICESPTVVIATENLYPQTQIIAGLHSITSERIGNPELKAAIKCVHEYNKSEGFTIGALEISPPMLDLKGILTVNTANRRNP